MMAGKSDDNIYSRELNTVLQFSALINSSLHIERVLDNAMKCAEEFIDAEASTIYEIDDEKKDELFIRLARGEKKEPVKKIRLKVGEGIAGYVVQTGKPMVIQDVQKEEKFREKFDKMTGFKTRSLICVPLMLHGNITGAIQVLNKKAEKGFTEQDLEILTSLSQQIAVAIENARLYERLEEKFQVTALELKNVQEKLIRTERIAAMGNLVNGIAHEIRNPITVIGGFARRIKDKSANNPEFINYSDIILGETERLERLVKQVRKLADVQTANLQPGSITPVLEETVKTFKSSAEEKGIEFVSNVQDDLPLINLDESQMVTALSNLFENAFESMNPGGNFSLKAGQEENMIILTLSDTGSGIADDELDSVYDPFVTSKTSGAGLGLNMVHQIISNHYGEINISSTPLKGTTVKIMLPIFHQNNNSNLLT
ncbi:ATP-binding protein [Thermodesulfobacteriota bacterium]